MSERIFSIQEQFNVTVEYPVFSVLILAAFGLLLVVSGGVAYLTLAEWRDLRRRDAEERANRPARRKS